MKYVSVALRIPFRDPLFYSVPEEKSDRARIGCRVLVPLKRQREWGVVVAVRETPPEGDFKVLPVAGILAESPVLDAFRLEFTRWIAEYYCCSWGEVIRASLPKKLFPPPNKKTPESLGFFADETKEAKTWSLPQPDEEPQLNEEQRFAVEQVEASMKRGLFQGFLLFGVTGSGKTEVYLKLAQKALERGRSVLVLIPEIALMEQTSRRFRRRLGDGVLTSHSGHKPRQRLKDWLAIRSGGGSPQVVVGTRSALFSPLERPGLVIVDEEHDGSYKQEETPFYQARDLAVKLASLSGAPVVLGSATPSVESYRNVLLDRYRLLKLSKRGNEAEMPAVEILDMKEEKTLQPYGYVSGRLAAETEKALADKTQAVFFLNRRGYDTRIRCETCSTVALCDNCNFPYTWHKRKAMVMCHVCGLKKPKIPSCPACGSLRIYGTGMGIQKLEEHLADLFPGNRVSRLDSDSVEGKEGFKRELEKIRTREVDLVVGTRMVSKGHDFPHVGLVGVVTADAGMNVPDFRASERTFQLISQVSGRGGRIKGRRSLTLIQTYNPRHPVILRAKANEYEAFYDYEIAKRETCEDPPLTKMIRLNVSNFHEEKCFASAKSLASYLSRAFAREPVRILGPAEWNIYRINRRYYRTLILKSSRNHPLASQLKSFVWNGKISPVIGSSRLSINVDP